MRRHTIGKTPLPEVYDVMCRVKTSKNAYGIPEITEKPIPVLLVSDMLSWMFTNFRADFDIRVLGGSNDSVLSFWSNTRPDDKHVWEHPAMRACPVGERSFLIPWGTHGDGVPITRAGAGSASLQTLSTSSLVGIGNTIDTHWLFSSYPTSIAAKRKPRGYLTSEPLWQTLMWDLQACSTGEFPSTDHLGVPWPEGSPRAQRAGQRIAGGYRLCHLYNRGDLDWHCNETLLAHWGQAQPCFKCPCDRLGNPWTDFENGRWKQESYTNTTFPRPDHPLFKAEWVGVRTEASLGNPKQEISKKLNTLRFCFALDPCLMVSRVVSALGKQECTACKTSCATICKQMQNMKCKNNDNAHVDMRNMQHQKMENAKHAKHAAHAKHEKHANGLTTMPKCQACKPCKTCLHEQ